MKNTDTKEVQVQDNKDKVPLTPPKSILSGNSIIDLIDCKKNLSYRFFSLIKQSPKKIPNKF